MSGIQDAKAFLNVAPSRRSHPLKKYRLNGRDVRNETISNKGFGIDLVIAGLEHEVECSNPNWELLVEFDDEKVAEIASESWDGAAYLNRDLTSRVDPISANLAQTVIDHMRGANPDRLFIEGLAISLASRSVSYAIGKTDVVPVGGTDRRIARALDYIEANLSRNLGVSELAVVAAMSPSWFAACFSAATGRPVHVYVMERRLELARTLLYGHLSLDLIALRCGFADASHLSKRFRAKFGATPGSFRSQGLGTKYRHS